MNLNLTTATRIGLNLSALLGIAVALHLGSSVFIPLMFSLLVASVLFPAVRFLHERLYFPWFFSCLITLLGVVALFLLLVVAFAITIPRTIETLPKTEKEWQQQYKKIQINMSQVIPYKVDEWLPPDPDQSKVYSLAKEAFSETNVLSAVGKIALGLLEYLLQATLIMFITLFLLLEGQMLSDKMRAIFGPSAVTQSRITTAIAEMAEAIRTYLVWRTIVNLGLALILGTVYYALHLQYWYIWALLVAVFSYVPYVGTVAAGVPPILEAMLFLGPAEAIGIGVFYTGVVTFEGYIIVPWVMGRSMDLNATTVLLACLFWYLLWGISGLFLAMPIMAAIKAVCMQVDGWQGWGDLMSSGPAKPLMLEPGTGEMGEMGRLEAIGRQAVNGDETIAMEDTRDPGKGVSPDAGDPKSDRY
jgi:AI-2 transport protein TqsA